MVNGVLPLVVSWCVTSHAFVWHGNTISVISKGHIHTCKLITVHFSQHSYMQSCKALSLSNSHTPIVCLASSMKRLFLINYTTDIPTSWQAVPSSTGHAH